MKYIHKKKHFSSLRSLKPKFKSSMKATKIDTIAFSCDNKGSTVLTIFPDGISINSRDVIRMIQENSKEIFTSDNTCILREEILGAIHSHPYNPECDTSEKTTSINLISNKIQEPRRPSNAFIMYNNEHRKKIKMLFPEFNNSEVSKLLGAIWKSISNEVKEKYIRRAVECRRIHKQKYPHFEYNLKRNLFAHNSSSTINDHSDNWDDYFDWCFENTSTQSACGIIQSSHSVGPNASKPIEETEIHFNSELDPFAEGKSQENWEEVYKIIESLFPEDDLKNTFLDEQLWSSLDQFTVFEENDNDFLRFS
ncbi:hypothetical protein BD560DRAFT_387115 [Blakeslea trispora]|nr:hypothetical protein BD560DRAFT_387115 [Blakeslea trispora]